MEAQPPVLQQHRRVNRHRSPLDDADQQRQSPPVDEVGQHRRVGLVEEAGGMHYRTRNFSNQAMIAPALAPECDGRPAMEPWLAPGTITKALGT